MECLPIYACGFVRWGFLGCAEGFWIEKLLDPAEETF